MIQKEIEEIDLEVQVSRSLEQFLRSRKISYWEFRRGVEQGIYPISDDEEDSVNIPGYIILGSST